jgi:hypothetical protein
MNDIVLFIGFFERRNKRLRRIDIERTAVLHTSWNLTILNNDTSTVIDAYPESLSKQHSEFK